MISILVMTPTVLSPFGSHSLANLSPSEVDKSWLAGITHRTIVLGSIQYLLAISVVIFSTSFWPLMSILVIPGRSMMVRSGQSTENIFSLMGSSTMFAPVPATSSVSFWMLSLTWLKSVYFLFYLSFSKIAYGFPYECLGSRWTRRSSRGRRVTTPEPLGRKSSPTMFSRRELFPLDWVPKTAILGSEIYLSRP